LTIKNTKAGVTMAEQWMSIVEYARTYQVSDMTIRRRIKTGKLHAVLKEGKYFIPVVGAHRATDEHEVFDFNEPTKIAERSSVDNQARRPHPQMQVIRAQNTSHRGATVRASENSLNSQSSYHSTQAQQVQQRNAVLANGLNIDDGNSSDALIPSNLRRPFATQDTSLVDTRALLAFCEASMRKFNELERRQIERFKSKLEALEAVVARKDLEIQNLRQNAEDLQLLVSTLERRISERR
jgi:predicted site-specific integrase-resolvase